MMEHGKYHYVQVPFENQQKLLTLVLKTRTHDDVVGKTFGLTKEFLDKKKTQTADLLSQGSFFKESQKKGASSKRASALSNKEVDLSDKDKEKPNDPFDKNKDGGIDLEGQNPAADDDKSSEHTAR